MRIAAGLLVVGYVATAAAKPAKPPARKPPNQPRTSSPTTPVTAPPLTWRPSPKRPTSAYPLKAILMFLEAERADRRRQVAKASEYYFLSRERSAQPNTVFNLGELMLRNENYSMARSFFKEYLELAPEAPDRSNVERLLAELEAAPPIMTLGGDSARVADDDSDGILVLDGVVLGTSPQTVKVSPGAHEVERVTATTYARTTFKAEPGRAEYIAVNAKSNGDVGNVIVRDGHSEIWKYDTWSQAGHKLWTNAPLSLPIGRHVWSGPSNQYLRWCTPIELEVKSLDELVIVRTKIDRRANDTQQCRVVHDVKVQRISRKPLRRGGS